jgi:iron complex transport system substrate-binding protein
MGDFTAGKGTFIGKMIEMAGGKNAADDVEGWSYSLEKLVEKNPDIMICSMYYDTKKGIQSTNGYKDLDAVKNGKLFEIDNNLLDRQGPRLADGLVELAKIIHPESFR